MSPSWDSTKAVAPGPEKLKWRSCPKTQETCGFRQLSQLGVVAIFPPNKGELSHLGVVAQTRIKPSFFGNFLTNFFQVAKSLDLTREKLAKLLLVSTQLAWRDPPLGHARRRLVQSGHGPKRGPLVRRPQQASAPLSAVRVLRAQALRRDLSAQALGEKKLKFFPYPIPYEKGERPYAIPDLSGG